LEYIEGSSYSVLEYMDFSSYSNPE